MSMKDVGTRMRGFVANSGIRTEAHFFAILAVVLATLTSTPCQARDPVTLVHGPSHFADTVAALLRVAYGRAGLEVESEALPRLRALSLSSTGQRDGEVFRTQAVLRSYPTLRPVGPPLMMLQTLAYARPGSGLSIASTDDLTDLTAAILRGALTSEALAQRAAEIVELSSEEQMLAFVLAGRADIAIFPSMSSDSALWPDGFEDVEVVGVLHEVPVHHMLHESRVELIESIEPILQDMSDTGEIKAFIQDRVLVY